MGGVNMYMAMMNNPVSRIDMFGLLTDCCYEGKLIYVDCSLLPSKKLGWQRVLEKMVYACGHMQSLYEGGPLGSKDYVPEDTIGAVGADISGLALSQSPGAGAWSSGPSWLWGDGLPADSIVGAGRTGPIASQELLQRLGYIGAGFFLYGAMGSAEKAGSSFGSGQYLEGVHDVGTTTLGAYSAASGFAAGIQGGALTNPLLALGAGAVLSWDLAYRNTMESVDWKHNLEGTTERCDVMRSLVSQYRREVQKLHACCGSN